MSIFFAFELLNCCYRYDIIKREERLIELIY